jgi:hypothetical protein
MYSQGCGGSSPFFGTSKVFYNYNASKDGFPSAVLAECAFYTSKGFPAHWRTRLPGGLYAACAAAVTISRRDRSGIYRRPIAAKTRQVADDGAELRPLWCAGHRLGQSSYKLSPSNQMADGKEHAVGHLLESSFR